MAITSQIPPRATSEEVWIQSWKAAGLLKPSVIKPVFGLDPVGRQLPLRIPGLEGGRQLFTIIGVVDDLRSETLDEAGTQPAVYTAAAQNRIRSEMWVVMRSRSGAPLNLAGAIRDAVRAADLQQPIGDMVTLEQLIGRQTVARRFNTTLLGLFAAQHSIMARPAFKQVLTRLVPTAIERSTYVLVSCLVTILLMWQWHGIDAIVWDVTRPALRATVLGLFAAGWLLVPWERS